MWKCCAVFAVWKHGASPASPPVTQGIPQRAIHFPRMQWHQQDREFGGDASIGVPLFAIQLYHSHGELGFVVESSVFESLAQQHLRSSKPWGAQHLGVFEFLVFASFHPTKVRFHGLWHEALWSVSYSGPLLGMLDTLNLAANKFEDVEKLKGLSERPSLRSVDVSSNYFEDGDALVNFWESNLPNVQCLYLHHNPCSRRWWSHKRHQETKCRVGSGRDVGSQWVFPLPHTSNTAQGGGGISKIKNL